MKKSLFALAMLGAFAGAAHAQSSVTIYGIADVGIQRVDNDAVDGATWGVTSGIQSGSRIGFRGTEDLGGGLKANFVLENGFNIDNGTLGQSADRQRLFGRQAWVGLSGGFGAVKIGRQLTPIFVALDTIDPLGTGLGFGEGGLAGTNQFRPYGLRMDNTLNYSFSAAGFSGELAYGFGEVPGSTATSRQMGAGASYVNGPITAVAAFHRSNDAVLAPGVTTDNSRTYLLGGAFDFRVAKVHAAFAHNRDEFGVAGDRKSRDYMLGVSAPIGAAGSVVASYSMIDDRTDTNNDIDNWAVGYIHNLSKRTNLYTSYSISKPDAADTDISWFNVGVRHKF